MLMITSRSRTYRDLIRFAVARQSELVKMTSMAMVRMTGLAAAWPSRLTRRGTPIKPELGNAAVMAPNAPSLILRPLNRAEKSARRTMTEAQRP